MEKMIQSMMKRFPLFIAMGFMIVIAAVIIGAVNAGNAASYYSVDKATRDASADLAEIRAGIESIIVWLPYFKFLGVAMILAGITMALGVISLRLQVMGKKVMSSVPEQARVAIPAKPKSATLMRMFMMLGMLIIIAGFIVSLSVAGTASWVYGHTVVEIDAAATGSDLLAGLAREHTANANVAFFSADKATREAAAAGSALVAANITRQSIPTWVPAFKFLGLGIMLGAITMALGTIVKTLRDLGAKVMSAWPKELTPGVPEKPRAARLFPMIMMMGWIILIVGLVWALSLNGVVASYWNHSIANELNPAQPGSVLLQQLGVIQGSLPWLGFLRFLGMAFLFTGITVALTVIIRTLQTQEKTLQKFLMARLGWAA